MDAKAIGNVTSAAVAAPSQPRAQQAQQAQQAQSASSAASPDRDSAARQRAEETTRAATKIPQRDPRSLQYQVDGATHRVVATIVDESSKTVVRQIPDAEILRIAQAIDRMQGFLVEEKA